MKTAKLNLSGTVSDIFVAVSRVMYRVDLV
jgi:hypothetical protein